MPKPLTFKDEPYAGESPQPMLYTKREYPCGCRAEGPGDVPAYCDTHDGPKTIAEAVRSATLDT